MTFTAVDLIGLKRDGEPLPDAGIKWLIDSYTNGDVADYQMSAMAMAIIFNGLDARELATWTRAMLESGDVLDFSDLSAPKIDKQDARIDWPRSAYEIKRQVRAYNPVPGAWFDLDGERIKVWEVQRTGNVHDEPGKLVSSGRLGLTVACGRDGLQLVTVQRPGKRRVTGEEFSTAVNLKGRTLDTPE